MCCDLGMWCVAGRRAVEGVAIAMGVDYHRTAHRARGQQGCSGVNAVPVARRLALRNHPHRAEPKPPGSLPSSRMVHCLDTPIWPATESRQS